VLVLGFGTWHGELHVAHKISIRVLQSILMHSGNAWKKPARARVAPGLPAYSLADLADSCRLSLCAVLLEAACQQNLGSREHETA
jgi:hypothetical protein